MMWERVIEFSDTRITVRDVLDILMSCLDTDETGALDPGLRRGTFQGRCFGQKERPPGDDPSLCNILFLFRWWAVGDLNPGLPPCEDGTLPLS